MLTFYDSKCNNCRKTGTMMVKTTHCFYCGGELQITERQESKKGWYGL